jgi:superfamily II DNA or RNA helicase
MSLPFENLPDLSKNMLVDLGGWAVLKEGQALFERNRVQNCTWERPELSGEVHVGELRFFPKLNLRSMAFAENRCSCSLGKSGRFCAHALALCIYARESHKRALVAPPSTKSEAKAVSIPTPPPAPKMRSLKVTDTPGNPLFFRFYFPPNFEQALQRNMLMLKLETITRDGKGTPEKLFKGQAFYMEPVHFQIGCLIEEWCGGALYSLLQLKTEQLTQLLTLAKGESIFYFADKPDSPLRWVGDELAPISALIQRIPEPVQIVKPVVLNRQARAEEAPKPDRSKWMRDLPSDHETLWEGSLLYQCFRLPGKDRADYPSLLAMMQENGFRYEASNSKWWLRDEHKTLNFLAKNLKTLNTYTRIRKTDNLSGYLRTLFTVQVAADVLTENERATVTLRFDPTDIDQRQLHQQIASGCFYLKDKDRIFLLPPTLLDDIHQLQKRLSGNPEQALVPAFHKRLSTAEWSSAQEWIESVIPHFQPPEIWKEKSAALRQIAHLKAAPIPTELDDRLRQYQRIGCAWLWHLYRNGLGGILADDMGLGKTVQALGFIDCVRQEHPTQPVLVVAPASLLENWQREAKRFIPHRTCFLHHRDQRLTEIEDAQKWDIIVTSYATLMRDQDFFHTLPLSLVIADEAQHVKNRKSQNAQALHQLTAKGRFILTGTPIENSLNDLRSLFAFIMPGLLQQPAHTMDRETQAWVDERHRQQAARYILRREKAAVAPELPEKVEQVLYCSLQSGQHALYQRFLKDTRETISSMEISGASEGKIRFAVFSQLLRLRQICAEPRILDAELSAADSAKWLVLEELIQEAQDSGHRMLVFSQFVQVLTFIRGELEAQGIPHCYLDGQTVHRQREVDRFNENDDIPVFLISLKAGGTGLNLTGADTVVHFDPWWNPAAERQATDRAHRIGQTRTVTSYKLIATDTIEEKVLEIQQSKAELLSKLFDESSIHTASVDLQTLKSLVE